MLYLTFQLFQCCNLSDLSGNILGCVQGDEEIKIGADQDDAVATGFVCIVENTFGVDHFKCNNKHWIIQRGLSFVS